MSISPAVLRMLTFAPMVDSETMRLLCRWYGISYAEDDHLFGWVSLLTILSGGYGRVPLLYGEGLQLSGPRALVDRCEPAVPQGKRLLPAWPDTASVEADWDAYNGAYAIDVAVFAYYHLLSARDLMTPVFAAPVPPMEARITPMAYPLLRLAFTLLLGLKAEKAKAAGERISNVFSAIDYRLADGRRFLFGDRLTLGDIAFAGASAPLLQPRGYGAKLPPVEAMPAPIRNLVDGLRSHQAARYIDAVYAELGSPSA